MLLKDVMSRDVRVVEPGATLKHAAQIMKEIDAGVIPVTKGEHVVGMLTDRDITVRATAEGRDPNSTRVRDVMSADVVYCFEDQDVQDAAHMMEDRQIRRLVVLNRDKRLVGIMSLGDLAVHTEDEELGGEELSETLSGVSMPARPQR